MAGMLINERRGSFFLTARSEGTLKIAEGEHQPHLADSTGEDDSIASVTKPPTNRIQPIQL